VPVVTVNSVEFAVYSDKHGFILPAYNQQVAAQSRAHKLQRFLRPDKSALLAQLEAICARSAAPSGDVMAAKHADKAYDPHMPREHT
jgi:hypothetical protein